MWVFFYEWGGWFDLLRQKGFLSTSSTFCGIRVKIGYPLQQIQMRRPFHIFLFFIKDIYNTSVFFPSTSINPLSCRAILFPNHPRLFPFFSYQTICVSPPGWRICRLLLFWQGLLRSNAFFSLDFAQPSFYVFSSPSNDCENISCLITDDGENVSYSPFQSIFWQFFLVIFFISDNENNAMQDLKLRG